MLIFILYSPVCCPLAWENHSFYFILHRWHYLLLSFCATVSSLAMGGVAAHNLCRHSDLGPGVPLVQGQWPGLLYAGGGMRLTYQGMASKAMSDHWVIKFVLCKTKEKNNNKIPWIKCLGTIVRVRIWQLKCFISLNICLLFNVLTVHVANFWTAQCWAALQCYQ